MILLSVVASGVIGGIIVMIGDLSTASVFMAVVATAIFSSLLCSAIFKMHISTLRTTQVRFLEKLIPKRELSSIQAQSDDIKVMVSLYDHAEHILDARQKTLNTLLEQMCGLQEKITFTLSHWSAENEKKNGCMQNAVTTIEQLNDSFLKVRTEIDALSGRTEDRASISAQMNATTDAIAENINQYSNFVIETSGSIEEMACATRDTAENIRELSASTERTVLSINTISGSLSMVRDNSERSTLASENVRTQAQQGLHSMAATMKAMQEIAKSNDESFDSINRLSRYSARVGDFLSVIQEVVEQTNLLSLNASIIAAQAGIRGRAFAVVAEEVRLLARRTSASTREIEELVRNIQKETASVQRSVTQGKDKVKEGVKISGMANETLVAIEKSAEDAFQVVSSIAVETNEQAVNIQRITEEAEKNLERVHQVTIATEYHQQGSKLIEENLEHMRDLAYRINSSVQEQAKGNRLYLKSVMDDNERTKQLKDKANQHLQLTQQAVNALEVVDAPMPDNTQHLVDALLALSHLIDHLHNENSPRP
ncbi:MAG: methyl-accepting chemotaxis protein [Desulfuromonadaceae bacterium]|nr:methyl-accepting chemotaxis protein [Desulfuromonadaceae bacterium]MDD5105158.1 methyl-accepting chemotaxis protein [Desulfuromonadaceae bacterium]